MRPGDRVVRRPGRRDARARRCAGCASACAGCSASRRERTLDGLPRARRRRRGAGYDAERVAAPDDDLADVRAARRARGGGDASRGSAWTRGALGEPTLLADALNRLGDHAASRTQPGAGDRASIGGRSSIYRVGRRLPRRRRAAATTSASVYSLGRRSGTQARGSFDDGDHAGARGRDARTCWGVAARQPRRAAHEVRRVRAGARAVRRGAARSSPASRTASGSSYALYNLAHLDRERGGARVGGGAVRSRRRSLAQRVGQSDVEIGAIAGAGLSLLQQGKLRRRARGADRRRARVRTRADWFQGRELVEALAVRLAVHGRADRGCASLFDTARTLADASDVYTAAWLTAECADCAATSTIRSASGRRWSGSPTRSDAGLHAADQALRGLLAGPDAAALRKGAVPIR